jgi:hypothetical protein
VGIVFFGGDPEPGLPYFSFRPSRERFAGSACSVNVKLVLLMVKIEEGDSEYNNRYNTD